MKGKKNYQHFPSMESINKDASAAYALRTLHTMFNVLSHVGNFLIDPC